MEKKENATKKNKKSVSASSKKGNGTKRNTSVNNKTVTKKNTSVNNSSMAKKNDVSDTIKVKEKNMETKKVEEPKIEKKLNYGEEPEFAGSEIRKLLIIIGAVCAVMLSFYFITEFVIKNKKEKENNTKDAVKMDTTIQYEEILMGSILNQGSGEYYILAYLEDEPYLSVYNSYIQTYNEKEGHKKVYKVNLSSDFNKAYLADEYFLEGNDITKIKVTGTTLIKIIDNSVAYSYREYATIADKFQRLIG